MQLGSADSDDAFALEIVGYEFPDHPDRETRYSWHQIRGRATNSADSWSFDGPALMCSESAELAGWLRRASAMQPDPYGNPDLRTRISFTEPNLALTVVASIAAAVVIEIELGYEFRSSRSRALRDFGPADLVRVNVSRGSLSTAATDWERDLAHYPDLLH